MKNLQTLISARVTPEMLPTNGKLKFDSNNNDSKGNYSHSCGNNNDNNNEYKYSYNNDNNDGNIRKSTDVAKILNT